MDANVELRRRAGFRIRIYAAGFTIGLVVAFIVALLGTLV